MVKFSLCQKKTRKRRLNLDLFAMLFVRGKRARKYDKIEYSFFSLPPISFISSSRAVRVCLLLIKHANSLQINYACEKNKNNKN